MIYMQAARRLIYFQIMYVLYVGILIELGFSGQIRYVTDAVTILLLILILFSKETKGVFCEYKLILGSMFVWWLFMVVSACVRDFSILHVLWASRNWARFFVFFVAVLLFLKKEDILKFKRLFAYSYIINFILVCVEFLFLGQMRDELGGIFGSMLGGNGQTNIFLCIILTFCLCDYFEKEKNIKIAFFVSCSSMIIAALEEIKIYFFEYLLIVALVCMIYTIKNHISSQELLKIVVSSVVGWMIGLGILAILFPCHFDVVLGKVSYSAYELGTSSVYKIGRIHFISQINELFFKDSLSLKLFGYGFGNCEYSKFNFLTSDFYFKNGYLNYLFFSHQILYLEGGLIGLILFVFIFAVISLQNLIVLFRNKRVSRYAVIGFVFGFITLGNVFYNNATRTEISYLTYFVLAVAYIMNQRKSDIADNRIPLGYVK